jgi:hypothetical protein
LTLGQEAFLKKVSGKDFHRRMYMLYEFAIIPDVFDAAANNEKNSIILKEFFRGICLNGLVANLYKDKWVIYIKENKLDLLDHNTRIKIMACLNTLASRNRLVRHPRLLEYEPDSDLKWLEHALASHNFQLFHAIISSKLVLSQHVKVNDELVDIEKLLDSGIWEERVSSIFVTKNSSDYSTYFPPILRHAKHIHLIDPFFDCSDRYKRTLKICVDCLVNRTQKIEFNIHAGLPEDVTVAKRLSDWESTINSINEEHFERTGKNLDIVFNINLWRQKVWGQAFHDRYILTEQCLIHVGHGLDCGSKKAEPIRTTWSLLEDNIRSTISDDFKIATSPYDFLGNKVIKFT